MMRTNVVIDDELLSQAMQYTGLKTKKAVIAEALRILIRLKSQGEVRSLRGRLDWGGNLDEMRDERSAVGGRRSTFSHHEKGSR